MNDFNFFNFNVNLIIANSLLLIAASLVYITFKLFEKKKSKSSHH
ncbi:MAG: hypothetical protein AAB553_00440 [Patescibacteria group bacterium]